MKIILQKIMYTSKSILLKDKIYIISANAATIYNTMFSFFGMNLSEVQF